MKYIIILDIIFVDESPKEKASRTYAMKKFKEFGFQHIKKFKFEGYWYLMVSDFSKLYLVRVEDEAKPKGKKEFSEFDRLTLIEGSAMKKSHLLKEIIDGFMIAYVEFNDDDQPIGFEFLKHN